jgi:endonuclease YncB( thermonuclease family)
MRTRITAGLVVLAVFVTAAIPAVAADSIYGKVTVVKSAEVVVINYGEGTYDIRIAGIDAPTGKERGAADAKKFVSSLLLGKNARVRFERRAPTGEMIGRVLIEQGSPTEITDVGIELLKQGLARRDASYDDKYGKLAEAEQAARDARRGLWAATPPK